MYTASGRQGNNSEAVYATYRSFRYKVVRYKLIPSRCKYFPVLGLKNEELQLQLQLHSFTFNLQLHDSFHPRIGEPNRGGGRDTPKIFFLFNCKLYFKCSKCLCNFTVCQFVTKRPVSLHCINWIAFWADMKRLACRKQGHPTAIFGKISVRKTT